MYLAGMYQQQENGSHQFVLSRKKVIVVGPERCGKTSLIFCFLGRTLPEGNQRVPAAEYDGIIQVLDKPDIRVMLWDVPMQDQHAMRRKESYLNSDVVFLCYAIDDPDSLTQATARWLPEIRNFLASPIILVGLKSDLRSPESDTTQDGRPAISSASGLAAKTQYNLKHFIECSARTEEGVVELFKYTRNLFDV